MINNKDNYVAWALLLMQLEDTQEHLGNLIKEIHEQGTMDEDDFSIQMGHIYAHLNRIWNTRHGAEVQNQEDYEEYSKFPDDIRLL